MLRERIISSLVFAPLVASAVYFGGYYFAALVVLVSGLGALEYQKMMVNRGIRITSWIIPCCAIVAGTGLLGDPLMLFTALVGCSLAVSILSFSADTLSLLYGIAGVLYIGGFLASFSILRATAGREWTLLILFITWATDVGAYLGGSAFGKHKMAPNISPNKSWEGAISGMVASGLTAFAMSSWVGIPVPFLVSMGLVLGVLAEAGDLAESLLKRFAGVKDSGDFMPGHGGVLDRFDSLFFTGVGGLLFYALRGFFLGV